MPTISLPKKLKASRVQITVIFTDDEGARAEAKALQKMGRSIRIEGFRPGKAPQEMLKRKIGPAELNEETVRTLLPDVFDAIVKEHTLQPIIPPAVDLMSSAPLTLTITFVEKPEVKVKSTEKVRIAKKDIAVKKEDVDRMLQYLGTQYRHTHSADRAAKNSDEVTVDFVGTVDGKEIEGTKATSYKLPLGSKSLIPGFEEQIVGMKKGEAKTFDLTFPADYRVEHLRGKPVMFSVTVQDVSEVHVPEFTDAFIKEHQLGESLADLTQKIEKTLRDNQEREDRARRERELFEAIRGATMIDLAPELITHEERMIEDEILANLQREKTSMEEWMKRTNRTVEKLKKELQEEATKRLTLRFAIQWLMDERKIEAEGEDEEAKWRKRVEKLVESMLK